MKLCKKIRLGEKVPDTQEAIEEIILQSESTSPSLKFLRRNSEHEERVVWLDYSTCEFILLLKYTLGEHAETMYLLQHRT
jgi:hypothetical protein